MQLELVTPPAAALVATSEAKTWLRVNHSNDDTLIADLVTTATKKVERATNRALINQTWKLQKDEICNYERDPWWDGQREGHIGHLFGQPKYISLGLAPVSSITTFSYFAEDNTEATYSAANYFLDSVSSPARLVLNTGSVWPTGLRDHASIQITFVAGYGSSSSDVPEDLITAVRLWVAHLYENRGDAEKMAQVPATAFELMEPYTIYKL